MRKIVLTMAVAALTVAFSAGAFAQESTPPSSPQTTPQATPTSPTGKTASSASATQHPVRMAKMTKHRHHRMHHPATHAAPKSGARASTAPGSEKPSSSR